MIDIVVVVFLNVDMVVAGFVDRGLMCNAPAVSGGLTGSGGDPLSASVKHVARLQV